MSNENWIEETLQLIISGLPPKPQNGQSAYAKQDLNDLREASIRFFLSVLMWKILQKKAKPTGNESFPVFSTNFSWDAIIKAIYEDKIWKKAPITTIRGLLDLQSRGVLYPVQILKKLFQQVEMVQAEEESVVNFFNQVYQECRNYELMQVQPEDPIVIRLRFSARGYIALRTLLTIPDPETILNFVIGETSERLDVVDPETKKRFRELCWKFWKEIEHFNANLQKSSGREYANIFSLVDPTDVKTEGEFYLQPMKSMRKGSGTFFTHRDLVKPIVERTIAPLVVLKSYPKDPKTIAPETFAELKVVDPAMGIGNFLLNAIDFMTAKFLESLKEHHRILSPVSEEVKIQVNPVSGEIWEFRNQADFNERIQAEIARYIATNCIFGVDSDPIAVEIAQFLVCFSCFSATGDRTPIITDLKVGNSLIGAWKRDLVLYPRKAFARKGFNATITNRIRDFAQTNQINLKRGLSPEKRNQRNQKVIETDPETMRQRMNLWCAIWFWDRVDLDNCPRPSPSFPDERQHANIYTKLAQDLKFFHWEVEFPGIFERPNPGFDVVLGNPPWEIVKPNSKEFFGKLDPLYSNMSKQGGLKRQKSLFQANSFLKDEWVKYNSFFGDFSNWVKYRAYSIDQPASDPFYPFQHQGRADLNLFKLFSEVSLTILRQTGRLGLVLPSGFYSDKGTQELRLFFLEHTKIEWLYSFENTRNIFPIHRNFKFFVLITAKTGITDSIRAKFMEQHLEDWKSANPRTIPLTTYQIRRLSPLHAIIPEILDQRELQILERIYQQGMLLGQQSSSEWVVKFATEFHMTMNSDLFHPASNWNVRYTREFDMTQDSRIFTPRTSSLEPGYVKDEFEIWRCAGKPALLPLYEGKLIDQYDFAQKAYAGGRGLRSKWVPVPYSKKIIEPQYLIQKDIYDTWPRAVKSYKIGFQSIARAVDPRTMVAAFLDALPCLNGVPVLQVAGGNLQQTLVLTAILNSYVYDFSLKIKCVGINLNYFILEETPVLKREVIPPDAWEFLCIAVARLNLIHPRFAPAWMSLKDAFAVLGQKEWKKWWAVSDLQRISLTCQIDAVIAHLFGLDLQDLNYILRDDVQNPKGFWRVDKHLKHELRHPVLTLQAFSRLKEVGIADFIKEEWDIPEPAKGYYGSHTIDSKNEATDTWEDCAKLQAKMLQDEISTTSGDLKKIKV